MQHKQKQYIKTRLFERLIAEIEQSLSHMADDDLERIIFLCWSVQQSRREDVGTIQKRMEVF